MEAVISIIAMHIETMLTWSQVTAVSDFKMRSGKLDRNRDQYHRDAQINV